MGTVVGQKMSRAGGLDSGGTGGASYALEDALDEPFIESDANSDGEPAEAGVMDIPGFRPESRILESRNFTFSLFSFRNSIFTQTLPLQILLPCLNVSLEFGIRNFNLCSSHFPPRAQRNPESGN